MAQRVDWAFFPGVREELVWSTVNKVFEEIRRQPMTLRDFREWLKDAGLWQKDEAPALLDFLDVRQAPHVHLGVWAEQMLGAKDDAAARDLLYKRLCDENLLLVKYVMQALDVDGGGRLHSTSELHRMLTSYVYPGKHLGRVAFEAWVKWLVQSGRVRLIGIRWGLTDMGKLAVPRLRTVDADEFLEDESARRNAAPSEPAALTKPTAQAPNHATTADQDDLPDTPPEADSVDAPTFAGHETRLTEMPAPTRRSPSKQAPRSESLAVPRNTAEILATLREIATQRGLDGGSLLQRHGLASPMAADEPARHLFLAALLARVCSQPDGTALVDLLRERAGGWSQVALLLDHPDALLECLARWHLTGNEPTAIRLRALLLEATLGGLALQKQAELPRQLAEAATSEQLFALLANGLLQATTFSERFWLVREMVKAGLWMHASATEVAFVPTRAVRLIAYRLRLLDNHFAESLPGHLNAARRLAKLMPAGSVESAALEALAPEDHLRFDCPHVVICKTSCTVASRDDA